MPTYYSIMGSNDFRYEDFIKYNETYWDMLEEWFNRAYR